MSSSQDGQAASGVVFPLGDDGRRSTAATGRGVWADAVRGVDDDLAGRIARASDWRKGYVEAVVAHTAAATRTAAGAVQVARAGLDSLNGRMRFERDGKTTSVTQAVAAATEPLPAATLQGEGERVKELVVPYRGEQLSGDPLRRQIEAWTAGGTIEASCAAALVRVLDEPDWLDLSDRAFALLGAGAELGPLVPLSTWGAHVVAVDVPVPRVWDRVRAVARAGSGTLTVPDGEPGVDLLTRTPEVAAFLRSAADGLPMTIGSYAYADGARHVQVVHASDAVVALLLRERPGTTYAELATPTDAFAVPMDVVEDSQGRWRRRGWRRAAQAPLSAVSRGALYGPAYATVVEREDGSRVGIADELVPQQGPNYTLAKRIQRWRATVASADGHLVSANVAPATNTRSVTKNRLLAAAYAGAGRFGVEVFAPETSRVLMAALLVHDLRVAAPPPAHPDDLFVSGAAHGGLWRAAYDLRSVIGLAAVTGLPSTLRRT
ncbi:MAG: hypothetical protein JWN88_1055 [Frankiales bacterium]|jgi:hypothetical protein|nr:hypothetical protein [Frankiales bacterium]